MKKVIVVLMLCFVTACGFKPLYTNESSSEENQGKQLVTINEQMEKIRIETIQGRFGQEVRNELIDMLSPRGAGSEYEYKLFVQPDEVLIERQALRKDITATRERARYRVVYYMTDKKGEELFKGDSVAYVSYDIMANPYSTTMAKKKAEEDAAGIISNDIVLRVGAYFHSLDVE